MSNIDNIMDEDTELEGPNFDKDDEAAVLASNQALPHYQEMIDSIMNGIANRSSVGLDKTNVAFPQLTRTQTFTDSNSYLCELRKRNIVLTEEQDAEWKEYEKSAQVQE
jgi:hypothetical protein